MSVSQLNPVPYQTPMLTPTGLVSTVWATWFRQMAALSVSGSGGSGSSVTFPISIAEGGTGETTAAAAIDALSPMNAPGDSIYGGTAGAVMRLAGNASTTKKFWTQTGSGSASAAPVITIISPADLNTATPLSFQTGAYTLTSSDYAVVFSGMAFNQAATLPTAVGIAGKKYLIYNQDTTYHLGIAANGTQTIGGYPYSGFILSPAVGDFIEVQSDGSNWQILGKKQTQYIGAQSTGTQAVSSASSIWLALTANSIALPPGQWNVSACGVIYTGSGIAYITQLGVFAAQGTGTATPPTALTGVFGTTGSLIDVNSSQSAGGPAGTIAQTNTINFDIELASTTFLYVVPMVIKSTGTGATTTASIWAKRVW